MSRLGNPDWEPVFVVGTGRSGTSLVQSMLSAHPAFAFPPETVFLRRFVATRALETRYADGGWKAVRRVLERDRWLGRLDLDFHRLEAVARGRGDGLDARLYQALLETYREERGAPRVGDKDPRAVEYLPLIAALWPSAYVVHVIRDPRDVLASRKRARWSRDRTVLAHVFATRVQVTMGRENGPRLFGRRYGEIRYEDLIADPVASLDALCGTLDVRYDASMLRFADAARELVAPEEMAWKKETLGSLLSGNAGRWRERLSGWEVALVECACRPTFLHHGYVADDFARRSAARAAARGLGSLVAPAERLYRAHRRRAIRRALD